MERKKAESAQAAAKLLEETQKKNEKLIEQKERSYQEHMKQLTEKMENDRIQLKAEQERILSLKLQVICYFCLPESLTKTTPQRLDNHII